MANSPDVPTIAYYMGKRLEDMSREELISALSQMGKMVDRMRENHAGDLRVLTGLPRHSNRL